MWSLFFWLNFRESFQLNKELTWHLMERCKRAGEQALAAMLPVYEKQSNFTQIIK